MACDHPPTGDRCSSGHAAWACNPITGNNPRAKLEGHGSNLLHAAHHTCCCDVADNRRSMRSSRAAVSIRALAAWSGSELRASTGRRGATRQANLLKVACWVLIESRWLCVWLTAVSGNAHRRRETPESAKIEAAIASLSMPEESSMRCLMDRWFRRIARSRTSHSAPYIT